jgi:S-adenosylmethionine:tRNA-ribosyltransferase-isomerase (queuine synthetase)
MANNNNQNDLQKFKDEIKILKDQLKAAKNENKILLDTSNVEKLKNNKTLSNEKALEIIKIRIETVKPTLKETGKNSFNEYIQLYKDCNDEKKQTLFCEAVRSIRVQIDDDGKIPFDVANQVSKDWVKEYCKENDIEVMED